MRTPCANVQETIANSDLATAVHFEGVKKFLSNRDSRWKGNVVTTLRMSLAFK
jgi:hypothetical protein